MEFVSTEMPLAGAPAARRLRISGGIPFARVDDTLAILVSDSSGLFSRRFHQDTKEINYKRNRTYDFGTSGAPTGAPTTERRARFPPTGRSMTSPSSTTHARSHCASARATN